jgi:glucuronoarabinoxylan endo-1,4-beta-xylanase
VSARLTARRRSALPALFSLLLVACDPSSGPRTGSQTNWLRACRVDTECDELRCLCGVCTRSCDAEASCEDLAGASCIPAEDPGAIALCSGNRPSSPGLCLPRCEPEACADGAACVAGVCSPIPEATLRVTIDTSTRHQTLVGFGATLGYVGNEIVQHPRQSELYDAMFAESGFDVLRLQNSYEDDNQDQLTVANRILEAATERVGSGLTTLLTSGSPPAALKANGSRECSANPDTCTLVQLADGSFDYAGFAAYWRASLEAYASAGIVPDYIGIQKNPNWSPPESEDAIESCIFLPTEGTATVSVDGSDVEVEYPGFAQGLEAVLAEFDGLASMPMIAAPEVSSYELVAEYAASLDFSGVDAIAHHMYGTDPAAVDTTALAALGELAQEYQRPLLQTEMRAEGFDTAMLMHYVLAVEGASAYLQNDFVASTSAADGDPMALISLATEEFTLEAPYHAMRHYALHTDPDWVRVAATADAEDLLASAWLSPDEDALTVVLVNAGQTELATELDLGEELSATMTSSEVTRTVFDGAERSAELGALCAEGIVQVPGHAILTVAWRR